MFMSIKIISISKCVETPFKSSKELTLDYKASYHMGIPFEVYAQQCINNTVVYKTITIKNCNTVGSTLTSLLTPHYVAGTTIVINGITFNNPYPKTQYKYNWINFDKYRIPKSLANCNVGAKTFLDALQESKSNYLSKELWKALTDYNQQRIAQCRAYNADYIQAEQWYKELMGCGAFKFYSPNAKTRYEFDAEQEFANSFELLEQGLRPLDESEKAFLCTYAPAYGIELQTFDWRINTRKTKHGYTQEPERVYRALSQSDAERAYADPRNKDKGVYIPKFCRDGLKIKSAENEKLLRDAYLSLMWMLRQKDDSLLMPGYRRCPICHKIYRETDGCDGHVAPIEFINADNLLYGISSTYEDYDSTKSAYGEYEPE